MKPAKESVPTGFIAGALLFAVGLGGILSPRLALLIDSTLTINDLPSVVALSCGYCSLVAITTSLVDRVDQDAAVGAYRLVGRWFVWAGAGLAAFAIGLFATRTRYADDLLKPDKLFFVAVVSVALIVVFAYLLQRSGKARPVTQRKVAAPGRNGMKVGLAIVLTLVAGYMLYQRYSEKLAREVGYVARDEAARRASKPWSLEFDALRGGMTVQEVKALALTTGHALRCHSDLRSEERLSKDDTEGCSVVVGEVWGIPALWTQFNFGDDGLRYQFIRFPEASWPQIEAQLDRKARRLQQTFGSDPESGRPVYGWLIDSGLVNSAPGVKGREISVLWTSKRHIALEYCARQDASRDAQRRSTEIRKLWPEVDCSKLR
jgi:hypothetical protein